MSGLLAASVLTVAGMTAAIAQEAGKARPEVGKPLQDAANLLRAQKAREALAKIGEADSVSNKTPYEIDLINRMRASAASAAGDNETAAKAIEAIIASGRASASEQGKLMESLVSTYTRAKDNAKAIQWGTRYLKEVGNSAQVRQYVAQAYYANGDYARAAGEFQNAVQSDVAAGRTPSENELQYLANCYLKAKDNAAYVSTIEKLLAYYPKREYWSDVLSRVQRKQGYSSRLDIDIWRLKNVTGLVHSTGDYMEMSQLALQAGSPAEAKKIVDQAFANGSLGSGSDAERHKRLRDLANKTLAEAQKAQAQRETEAAASNDGQALVNLGFEYVGEGKYDKGLPLIEKGIKKGGLKYPEDAKLHLGVAYYMSGQKGRAVEMFKTVKGNDGTADIARLWILQGGKSAS
ncbi:MAG: tetratricopeptide repeat protein [Rhodospirillales bacterium]